jgi:predicted Zn-dependent protease
LNQDPENITAHKLLAQAAMAADLPRTAILSLQTLTEQQPYHRAIKLELAEALASSGDISAATAIYGQLLKDNPQDGKVQQALQRISAQFIPEPAPAPANGHVPDQPAAPARIPTLQPLRRQPAPVSAVSADDAIIHRFEPLLVHGPKNTKFLKTLAEAYARKMMFDKSLSYYQNALKITGGKNAAIEKAIEETTLKKLNWELSKLDPATSEYAAQRERIQNKRLEFQWHAMEEAH